LRIPKVMLPILYCLAALAITSASVVIEFWRLDHYRIIPALTLDNLHSFLTNRASLQAFANSLRLAVTVAPVVALVATAAAILIPRLPLIARVTGFATIGAGLLLSYVGFLFGWRTVAADGRLVSDPALILELTYFGLTFPLAFLTCIVRSDENAAQELAAARNLGISALRMAATVSIERVLARFSAAFAVSFAVILMDVFVSPVVTGGYVYTFGSAIVDQLKVNQIPVAAAMTTIGLGSALLTTLVVRVLCGRLSVGLRALALDVGVDRVGEDSASPHSRSL
jgi:ABC-type spermidine/putrescine transport system permease subunit II